jgi:hypothetical protein
VFANKLVSKNYGTDGPRYPLSFYSHIGVKGEIFGQNVNFFCEFADVPTTNNEAHIYL